MLRERLGERLDRWLAQVGQSSLPELQSKALGVEKDKEAVRAGLTWWINNGVVEGHVTKLKLIKRQGYGRAGFPRLAQACPSRRVEGGCSARSLLTLHA
jgi:transposase